MLQISLKDIQSVSLVDRRGYLTVVMEKENEDILVVRRPENLREWYNKVQGMVRWSKNIQMVSTEEFWAKKAEKYQHTIEVSQMGGLDVNTERKQKSSHTASLDRRRRKDKNNCK